MLMIAKAEKKVAKILNLGRAGDRTGDLVVKMQRSYQLRQPRMPKRLPSICTYL